jgi:methylmalonyl-CoA mutase cobalamin-binding subunit
MEPHRKGSHGTVVLGGTESDVHVVSLYLVSIMLAEAGYRVVNRACQNPVAELMAQVPGGGPVLAYLVCNQNGHALEDLRALREHKSQASPVILGGHYTLGCHDKPEQQSRLREVGVDYFAETLEEVIPMLEQIAAMQLAPQHAPSQHYAAS